MNNFFGLIDLPKQLLGKAEKLLVAIFGSATNEFGEIFGDKIRYVRFKHSLKIIAKAQDLVEKKGIAPKEISLKHLIPILQKCSLEDDDKLQQKWANLIANFATDTEDSIINKKNIIDSLSSLSIEEIEILDHMYDLYLEERTKILADWKKDRHISNRTEIYVENVQFKLLDLRRNLSILPIKLSCYVENMESLGIIYIPNKGFYGGELNRWDLIHFTNKGLSFIKNCNI